MSKIFLPNHHWLISHHEGHYVTNTYSGSLGTLPERGCTCTRTFNYRVYVDISSGEETRFQLVAECFIIQPWSEGGNKTNFEQSAFENSPKGITDAEVWLTQKSSMHGF